MSEPMEFRATVRGVDESHFVRDDGTGPIAQRRATIITELLTPTDFGGTNVAPSGSLSIGIADYEEDSIADGDTLVFTVTVLKGASTPD